MQRFETGAKTVELLKQNFAKAGVYYEDLGREHQIKNPKIAKGLNLNLSPTASFIRFQPDLIVFRKKLFLVEVKTGHTIQKDCFEHYLLLENSGINILIFFLYKDKFHFCKPSEIPFYKYPIQNGKICHKKANLFIAAEEHWIFPNRLSKQELQHFKRIMKASGKPFAYLHIQKLKKLPSL